MVEPLQTTTAILTGSKWSCLLFRIVWQHALSEVLQAYPPVKMQGCVDEIAVCVEGKNSELPNSALTVLKKAKIEVEKVSTGCEEAN